jgi:hypothetical protein
MKNFYILKILALVGWVFLIIFGFLFLAESFSILFPESIGKFMLYDDGGYYEPIPSRTKFIGPLLTSIVFMALAYVSLKRSRREENAK